MSNDKTSGPGYNIPVVSILPGTLLSKPVKRQEPKSAFLRKLEAMQAKAAKESAVVKQMEHYRKLRK